MQKVSEKYTTSTVFTDPEGRTLTGKLFPLKVGDLAIGVAASLISEGASIANMPTIASWLDQNPEITSESDLVIIDPFTTTEQKYGTCMGAHSVHVRKLYRNGFIDRDVRVSQLQLDCAGIYLLVVSPR